MSLRFEFKNPRSRERLAIARRAAEVKERRTIFAANANASADKPTNNP